MRIQLYTLPCNFTAKLIMKVIVMNMKNSVYNSTLKGFNGPLLHVFVVKHLQNIA
jgi:hypothetical protein